MSRNIHQVYIANPITSNASTDLMYFGQSPYGASDDAAMTYQNFAVQFLTPTTGVQSLTGTANQVLVNGTTGVATFGPITLTLPQDIATTSSPTFLTVTTTNDSTFHGVNVGLGAGSIASNTRVGNGALASNTSGSLNVAVGFQALNSNTTGGNSTAVGYQALMANSGSGGSTALGYKAGLGIVSGIGNTAIGSTTMVFGDATGCVAIGFGALENVTGSSNVAVGNQSGNQILSGVSNSLFGVNSGNQITTGNVNTLIGINAGITSGSATGIITGSNNICLGGGAGTNATDATGIISIGYLSVANKATGSTSGDTGPQIALGSTLGPVGFRGDGKTFGGGTTSGWWQPNINSQNFFMPLFLAGTSTASSGMVTDLNGLPVLTSAMTNGQLIIGSTGATPATSTLTAGTGVSITNGAGSITISTTGGGLTTSSIAGTTQAAAVNTRYIVANAGQTTITLPTTFAIGDVVIIKGLGAGGWILAAGTATTIRFGSSVTSSAGSLTSANQYDTVYVTGLVANTTWSVDYALSSGLTVA